VDKRKTWNEYEIRQLLNNNESASDFIINQWD
jgi:hypothetical protein